MSDRPVIYRGYTPAWVKNLRKWLVERHNDYSMRNRDIFLGISCAIAVGSFVIFGILADENDVFHTYWPLIVFGNIAIAVIPAIPHLVIDLLFVKSRVKYRQYPGMESMYYDLDADTRAQLKPLFTRIQELAMDNYYSSENEQLHKDVVLLTTIHNTWLDYEKRIRSSMPDPATESAQHALDTLNEMRKDMPPPPPRETGAVIYIANNDWY